MISAYLMEQGHHVIGFSRHGVSFLEEQVLGDAQDESVLIETIGNDKFDVVINCIGILNQYAEQNPEVASYSNGELPHILARITQKSRTRIFHMSTDCVFAGNTGPYTEDSVPDGETIYDRTKAAGELNDSDNLTFRCSIVGPDTSPSGIGLFNWCMAQNGPIRGYTGAIWTGLTTLELAKAMEVAAEEDVTGLVNMVPSESISKFNLLQLFNKYLRGGSVEIEPDERVQLNKTLVRTNFDSSYRPRDYLKQIAEMANWIRAHAEFYPHYKLG